MELLAQGLALQVKHLHLSHTVTGIDPLKKKITARHGKEARVFQYTNKCLSTLPLPFMMDLCKGIPASLRKEKNKLRWNRVLSIGISVKGKRPKGMGHWRYYTDPTLPWTRLIFMHEFDPYCAPPEGWALLVEITVPAAQEGFDIRRQLQQVMTALKKAGVLTKEDTVIGKHWWFSDPAYVIFTRDTSRILDNCFGYLEERGITSSGRYGKWEYSSMSKNMADGFAWAQEQL
jgi:hypothetical protein